MEQNRLVATGYMGDILKSDMSILSNSTFDMNALDETMRIASLRSFSNLYGLQRTKVGIEKFVLHFSDFIFESRFPGQVDLQFYPKQYVHYFNYRMLLAGREEEFRRSALYGKLLSMYDIAENHKFFSHNFLIFMDKKLVTTAELYPMGDKIRISIDVAIERHPDGLLYETYKKYEEMDPEVIVYMVPNYSISYVDLRNARLMEDNFTTSKSSVRKLIGCMEEVCSSDKGTDPLIEKFNKKGLWFTNIETDTSLVAGFQSNLIGETDDDEVYTVKFTPPKDFKGKIHRVLTIGWEHGFKRTVLTTKASKSFAMKNPYPIPTENFWGFIRKAGEKTFLGDIIGDLKLKLYYPNLFKLDKTYFDKEEETSPDMEVVLYHFFNELSLTENEKYHNDLAFFHSRCSDLVDRLEKESLEQLSTDYYPESFTYGPGELHASIWFPVIVNYKFAKLRAFIEKNPYILELYWDILGYPTEKYYVDCTKIGLKDRRRTSNKLEIDSGDIIRHDIITFDEERYVIVFRRDFLNEDEYAYRFWIDGLLLMNTEYTMQYGNSFYYFYIPTRLIQETSMIEVERYRLVYDVHEATVSSSSEDFAFPEIRYTPPADRKIQANDIFVALDETKEYLKAGEDYCLLHYSDYLKRWIVFPEDSAYIVDGKELRIQFINPRLVENQKVIYGAYEAAFMQSSDPYDPLGDNPTLVGKQMPYVKMDIPNLGNYSKSSYRMFMNKRACSSGQFYLRQSLTYGGTDSVRTITEIKEGDVMTLDRVPGNYKMVHYEEMIGENGFIDLDGKIPLPLSFKWYDIYLNGLRLNKKHVDFVSPTKMFIKNVSSRRNLIIYQRNHDDDVFYLTSFAFKEAGYSKTIMDELMILSYSVKTELNNLYSIIVDSERDFLEGGQYPEEAILGIIIFEEILKYTFFNPNKMTELDEKKINEIIKLYSKYYNGYSGVFDINGNIRPTASLVLEVNCNREIEEAQKKGGV